jgi:hypothetical protein
MKVREFCVKYLSGVELIKIVNNKDNKWEEISDLMRVLDIEDNLSKEILDLDIILVTSDIYESTDVDEPFINIIIEK